MGCGIQTFLDDIKNILMDIKDNSMSELNAKVNSFFDADNEPKKQF